MAGEHWCNPADSGLAAARHLAESRSADSEIFGLHWRLGAVSAPSMQLQDLEFSYPPELVAMQPQRPSRVAVKIKGEPARESSVPEVLSWIGPDDLLVINDTKVIPARIFANRDVEILFLKSRQGKVWDVLFPARDYKIGAEFQLPGDVQATLITKGLPQQLRLSKDLDANYFAHFGEMALPPYIQEARGERHNRVTDPSWYQSAWAERLGSVAAPTASLHFRAEDLQKLNTARLTLHVGAGTFFPVRSENLGEHQMHFEAVEISAETVARIEACKGKVWALGTTSARALESIPRLTKIGDRLVGETNLFIFPPYEFQYVDALLTNFHQPRSTLLALVAAFAGLEEVQATYRWAIEQRFRLFSYGDLSVWL